MFDLSTKDLIKVLLIVSSYILFFQTELGKPKRRGVLIPGDYIYGRPNEERDGGSSEGIE